MEGVYQFKSLPLQANWESGEDQESLGLASNGMITHAIKPVVSCMFAHSVVGHTRDLCALLTHVASLTQQQLN